jgi:hypothetical protein
MKAKPTNSKPATNKVPYTVTLDGQIFLTYAHNEAGAISNVAYRYAIQEDMDVKLVMWKIKQDELDCEVLPA